MKNFEGIRHFSPKEFRAPDKMDRELLVALDRARALGGRPIYVTSSYREGDPNSHGRGLAVDVADNPRGTPIASGWRFAVVRALLEAGFRRIGVYDRHIHADMDPALPDSVMWWGTSQ